MPKTELTTITLHLARTAAFPEGSDQHGYVFVAPLDDNGHIDADSWLQTKSTCVAHRFRGNEPIKHGLLVRRAGGHKGATWGFDYNRSTHADDEMGFHFGEHAFTSGEYVSISDSDGGMETFKIYAVSPL